jgi:hypothetical protein
MIEEFWKDRTVLRWMMTQWCNYACWYCRQDHSRVQMYRGGAGHWIDNRPIGDWLAALDRFDGTTLVVLLTGGEPMLDRVPFRALLAHLSAASYVEAVRVDTNLSWRPHEYAPSPKVKLMASYHPSEVEEQQFFARLDAVLAEGWSVSVGNYVVTQDRVPDLPRVADLFASRGVPINVLPAFGAPELVDVPALRRYIHPKDWPHRFGAETRGKPCLFPTAAYEMQPNGDIRVGCHGEMAGSIFAELPARFVGYTPCPHQDCFCVDKYTFLQEMDCNTDPLPMESLRRRIPLEVLRAT